MNLEKLVNATGPVSSVIPKQAANGKFNSIKKRRVELEQAPAPTTKSFASLRPRAFFTLFNNRNFLNCKENGVFSGVACSLKVASKVPDFAHLTIFFFIQELLADYALNFSSIFSNTLGTPKKIVGNPSFMLSTSVPFNAFPSP